MMAVDFEAVRRDHPLEEVAGRSLRLIKSGRNKVAVCPFHPDRSPSLVFFPDETFHCFGCGKHGDVIDFIAESHNLSISDAIKTLTGGEAPKLDEGDIERRRNDRAVREAEFKHQQDNAIQDARARWARATPINGGGHPYLTRKGIAPHGARTEGDNLLVPVMGADGLVQTVQLIPAEPGAKKLFHGGAPAAGGRLTLGQRPDGPLIVCEGFATGATVHAATELMVVIAFSKGNIAAIVEEARKRYPSREIVIGADLDGEEKAHDVAERFAAKVVVPGMEGAEGSDFNDQAAHFGLEDVARTFRAALAAEATPLPLIWYKDIRPCLTGNWIVKNVIPAEAFATIIGHPGCGKSFAALDLALHIASGTEWQGRRVKRGLVIYLAAEGQRGQFNRVEAWRRHYGTEDLDFAMIPVAINLRDREADVPKLFETIRAAVARAGGALLAIVVDTLNRTFGGGDENGPEMTDYVDNVGRIKAEFGCTTIIVHHIPKNAETITERGHGSLRGAIETSLVVSSDAETGVRTLKCSKQKDAEDGWSLQFKLHVVELGEDEDAAPVTSCVVVGAENEMAAARSRGPSLSPTQRQVYSELLATLEAAPVSVPRDIPDDVLDRTRVGKVAPRKAWRERWFAIGGGDKSDSSAGAIFRRAAIDLQNKGLIGIWNDHAWATHD